MASYNNYSDNWYVTVNGGTGTVYLDASLQVNGNITYVSQLEVNDAFIIAAANNSSAANVTAVGFLAGKPTTPISYAGIQYNATADAWQISTNVYANGVANTAYANISTAAAYGNANVVTLLAAFGSNTISTTGTITSGNIVAPNVIVGNVTTNLIRSDDSSYVTVQDGLNVVGDVEVSGIITTNLIRSNDSSYLTVQDGLNVIGDVEAQGYIIAGNVISDSSITPSKALADLTATDGARAFVNDANLAAAGNFGAQIASGGGNLVPVWSDGSNWYIG